MPTPFRSIARSPLSDQQVRAIQAKVDGVYFYLKATQSLEQQTLIADLVVARRWLIELPALLRAERIATEKCWRRSLRTLTPKQSLVQPQRRFLPAVAGWASVNDDHPPRRLFESHETGVGCYEFEAEFDQRRDPLGDRLCGVAIVAARRLEGDELVEVTRDAELRLLAGEAAAWWENAR